jgi:hypothetical protein
MHEVDNDISEIGAVLVYAPSITYNASVNKAMHEPCPTVFLLFMSVDTLFASFVASCLSFPPTTLTTRQAQHTTIK